MAKRDDNGCPRCSAQKSYKAASDLPRPLLHGRGGRPHRGRQVRVLRFKLQLCNVAVCFSASSSFPCVILEAKRRIPASFFRSAPYSVFVSFRAKRRTPNPSSDPLRILSLCHSERSEESRIFFFPCPCKSGRGSKVRVLVRRAIFSSRDSTFCARYAPASYLRVIPTESLRSLLNGRSSRFLNHVGLRHVVTCAKLKFLFTEEEVERDGSCKCGGGRRNNAREIRQY
jgi:hypothetical protein